MVDTGILSNNMKFLSHKCEMTFCDLIIYNDNPLLIRLCTELDLLPNFEWFPWNICDGCGMPTGDAYSSGHLVPSLWDLHMFYLLRPILFRTCRYFTGLCSSNIPRYFLDFASSCDGPDNCSCCDVRHLCSFSDVPHCCSSSDGPDGCSLSDGSHRCYSFAVPDGCSHCDGPDGCSLSDGSHRCYSFAVPDGCSQCDGPNGCS